MRLSDGRKLIEHKQFLEKLITFDIDEDGFIAVGKGKKAQYAVVLQIGGVDIFGYSDSDKQSCYAHLSDATLRLGCQSKLVFIDGKPQLDEQIRYVTYKHDKQHHPFRKAILRKQLDELQHLEATAVRETFLMLYATEKKELLRLAENFCRDMPDLSIKLLDSKAQTSDFVSRYMTFGTDKTLLPNKIEFKQTHFIINDTCFVAEIVVDGYPDSILNLQYASTIMGEDNVVFTIDFSLMDNEKVLNSLKRSMQEVRSRDVIRQTEAELIDNADEQQQLVSLYENIQHGTEQLVSHTLHLYVHASSFDELNERLRAVGEALERIKFKYYIPHNYTRQSFVNLLHPYDSMQVALPVHDTWGKQFPFFSQDFVDAHGTSIGYTATGGMWILDPFSQTSERTSYDMCITGGMGSGKSVFIKSLLAQRIALGDKVIAFDVEGELRKTCRILGGRYIDMSQKSCINVLQLNVSSNAGLDENFSNYPSEISRIVTFFSIVSPQLTDRDKAVLENVLNEMYSAMGITSASDLYAFSPMDFPKLQDLLDTVRKMLYTDIRARKQNEDLSTSYRTSLEGIELLVEKLINSNGDMFNGHSSFAFGDEDFIAINVSEVSKLSPELFQAVVYNIINMAWSVSVANSYHNQSVINPYDIRNVIVVYDEAHMYLNDQSMTLVREILSRLRRNRKYLTANWYASQAVSDYVAKGNENSDAAKEIFKLFSLCRYKAILKQDGSNVELLGSMFPEFTDSELNAVPTFQAGEMLFTFSSNKAKMRCFKTIESIDLLWLGTGKDGQRLREEWYEAFSIPMSSRKQFLVDYTTTVLDAFGYRTEDSQYFTELILAEADKVYEHHFGGDARG